MVYFLLGTVIGVHKRSLEIYFNFLSCGEAQLQQNAEVGKYTFYKRFSVMLFSALGNSDGVVY